MIEFKESKFYKLLQDFFINNDKETFLQMLGEFYNRTEGIIEKDDIQDKLLNELRELYLEFNEKGIDENIVREKVNQFVENNEIIKDVKAKLIINTNKIEDITSQLATIMRYPLLLGIENVDDVKDYRYPYCHVHRYGGKNDGTTDNSKAIQLCVDITEKMRAEGKDLYPIRFESGVYVVKNTIKIKCGTIPEERNTTPITILGYPTRYIDNELGHVGTIIRPQIPNHTNKNYSNLFAINVKYDNVDTNNEIDLMVNTSQIMSNIKINDISFYLSDSESYNEETETGYKVNVIKGYRFRPELKNISANNMNSLVNQPTSDITGTNKNICDFSRYENINFVNIIEYGLRLKECDNSRIIQITNHRPRPTMKAIISIVGGSGITIEQFHSAYHFINNTLTPRQDGTGKTGNKAYILLNGCKSVKIDGTHIERCLADYFVICKNVQGLELKNHFERFFSNGLLRYDGATSNIVLENICRNITLVDEYDDILCENQTEFTNNNISIKNFLKLNYYNENITLSTNNYSALTRDNNNTKKHMRFYTNEVIQQSLDLPIRKFRIMYDSETSSFKVYNNNGSLNNDLTVTFENSVLTVTTVDAKRPFKLLNTSCIYHSAVPVIPYTSLNKIKFYSLEGSKWVDVASAKSNCEIICGIV